MGSRRYIRHGCYNVSLCRTDQRRLSRIQRRSSAKNSSQQRRPRARGTKKRNRASGAGINAPPRQVRNLPISRNPIFPITRALRRGFVLTSSTIDGLSASTLQITFAPSATDFRLDGVSIYSDVLPDVTDFSNLFDQWRLKKVIVRFDFAAGYNNSASTPIIMPSVWYVSDYDDPNSLSLTNMLQYPQVQVHNFYKNGYEPLQVSLSPKPLRDVAGAGVSTGYGPMPVAPWLRTADMSLPHYGMKFALDWMGKSQSSQVQMIASIWYELEFTNPK